MPICYYSHSKIRDSEWVALGSGSMPLVENHLVSYESIMMMRGRMMMMILQLLRLKDLCHPHLFSHSINMQLYGKQSSQDRNGYPKKWRWHLRLKPRYYATMPVPSPHMILNKLPFYFISPKTFSICLLFYLAVRVPQMIPSHPFPAKNSSGEMKNINSYSIVLMRQLNYTEAKCFY